MASHGFVHFEKCLSDETVVKSKASLSLYQAIHPLPTRNSIKSFSRNIFIHPREAVC